jgi:hypothetical protein
MELLALFGKNFFFAIFEKKAIFSYLEYPLSILDLSARNPPTFKKEVLKGVV